MSITSKPSPTQTIRLRNTRDVQQQLWFEPLGDKVELAPNVLYELTASNAVEEIDFTEDGFVVYGWITRVAEIDENGASNVIWQLPE